MPNWKTQLQSSFALIICSVIFLALLILGITILSYVIIIIALFGIVAFVVAQINSWFGGKNKRPTPQKKNSHRVIDHDE